MRLVNEISELKIERIGDTQAGIKANIDVSSFPFIFELLTKGFYSNAIGSVVREITSNCFDAHIEAGVDDPVVISKTYSDEEGWAIEFKDVGVGISAERFVKIYMNYFSSTKRDTNEQIGGFGLGSKTPLAYTDMFYINSVHDGLEYNCIMHRGEEEPELDSLFGWQYLKGQELNTQDIEELDENEYFIETEEIEESEAITRYFRKIKAPQGLPTDKNSGTVIKIILQDTVKRSYYDDTLSDLDKFTNELKYQLAYFDNVYFYNWGITNDYDIYEGKYFKFRSDIDQSDTELHIVLGKVRYPIDFNRIKVPANYRKIPVGVKFDIGELKVTPNRENLRYKDDDIKLIVKRIELAVAELKHIYSNQNPAIRDLREFNKVIDETAKISFGNGKHFLKVWANSGLEKSYKFAPLQGLNIKKTPRNMFFMYEAFGCIDSKGKRVVYTTPQSVDNNTILNHKFVLVFKEDKYQSMYTDLKISEYYESQMVYLIRRKDLDYKKVFDMLGIKDTKELGKAKTVVGFVRIMANQVLQYGKRYVDLKADGEWISEYKRRKREGSPAYLRRIKNQVFIRNARLDFKGQDIPVADLQERTGILVYGYKEDREILQAIYKTVVKSRQSLIDAAIKDHKYRNNRNHKSSLDKAFMVIQIASSNEKAILGAKKTIHWEDFFDTKYFREIETAHHVKRLLNELKITSNKIRSTLIDGYDEARENVINTIKPYLANFSESQFLIPYECCSRKYIEELLDPYYQFKDKYAYKIPLLDALDSHVVLNNSHYLESLVDYLKERKIRLKGKYYGTPSSYLII